MLLWHEEPNEESEAHPYWYTRIIRIFHVDIMHSGSRSTSSEKQQINFLWVGWFRQDVSFNAGWSAQRLHHVGFLNVTNSGSGAFGFLNPSTVIRSVHIIPAFANGQTGDLLHPPRSVARQPLNEECDWQYNYIHKHVSCVLSKVAPYSFVSFLGLLTMTCSCGFWGLGLDIKPRTSI